MTTAPQLTPTCTVCGTPVSRETPRCPTCGLSRPGARGADVLGRHSVWLLGGLLLVVYVVVLLIVAAAR